MLQFNVHGSIAGENLAWGTGSRGTAARDRRRVAREPGAPREPARARRSRGSASAICVGSFLGHRGAHVVTADFAG